MLALRQMSPLVVASEFGWSSRPFFGVCALGLCITALLVVTSGLQDAREPALLFEDDNQLLPSSLSPQLLPSTMIHEDRNREIPSDAKLRAFNPKRKSCFVSCTLLVVMPSIRIS